MYRSKLIRHSHYNSFKGFSLIELMVVMAIMAVLMGLTGGLVTKTVAQQERQVEIEKVHQLFKQLSYKAFFNGLPIAVKLSNQNMEVHRGDEISVISFNQLTFVSQEYSVSTSAIVSPNQFSVFWGDNIKNIELGSVYESFKDE